MTGKFTSCFASTTNQFFWERDSISKKHTKVGAKENVSVKLYCISGFKCFSSERDGKAIQRGEQPGTLNYSYDLPQPECQCYCSYIITCVVKNHLTLVLTSALILAGTAANSGDSAYAVRLSTLFISGLVEAAHASLLLSDMSLANTWNKKRLRYIPFHSLWQEIYVLVQSEELEAKYTHKP